MNVLKLAFRNAVVRVKLTDVWLCFVLALAGCDNAYPEVIIVNSTNEHVLVREISFNGCLWNRVLAFSEASSPQRCSPGTDSIHFQRFDAAKYCRQQAEDSTLDGVCACNPGTIAHPDPGLVEKVPLWFNYQTLSRFEIQYGDFMRIEINLTDMEQDFSVPGPYGH